MSERIKYKQISTSILKNNLIAPESTEEDFEDNSNKESPSLMNSRLNNFRTIERSSNPSIVDEKIERVRKLSEKLSKLQIQEDDRPKIINKLESRFETIEDNIIFSYETLKSKYNTLKDHTEIIKKRLEEESENKEDYKKSITEKLKNLQNRARAMITEEHEHFKSYSESICLKLEAELIKCESELKRDDDLLVKNINDIKENIMVDLPEISNKIENEREERERSMDILFQDMNLEFNKLSSSIQEINVRRNHNTNNADEAVRSIINSVTETIYFENEKMMKFKDNIYRLLDQTSNQITNK